MLGLGAPHAQRHFPSQKGLFLPGKRLSCALLALAFEPFRTYLKQRQN